MNLVFVAGEYPSAEQPGAGTFVRQLVLAVARQGHRCTVVNPIRWLSRRFGPLPPQYAHDETEGSRVVVHRPRTLSFSMKRIGPFRASVLTQGCFNRAVQRTVRRLAVVPDVLYGHFLYLSGFAALRAAQSVDRLAVAGVGEGTLWSIKPVGPERARRQLAPMGGFLAVSHEVRRMLEEELGVARDRIGVFPNGVDRSLFYPRDRAESRVRLGLQPGLVYLAFVGTFEELKGADRLLEAVREFPQVRLIMAGSGPLTLVSPQICFQGTVAHHRIPELLSAADMFVLPTQEEGSCNAVIEAMACGLPIITSNGPYMDDVVNDDVAVRVDPRDTGAIRAAIGALAGDEPRRRALSRACLEHARRFDINDRARRILAWMGERLSLRPA